jgi:hypothetical protein
VSTKLPDVSLAMSASHGACCCFHCSRRVRLHGCIMRAYVWSQLCPLWTVADEKT